MVERTSGYSADCASLFMPIGADAQRKKLCWASLDIVFFGLGLDFSWFKAIAIGHRQLTIMAWYFGEMLISSMVQHNPKMCCRMMG